MIDDRTLDARLRALDPAPRDTPVDADRKAALLESVLATDPALPSGDAAPLPARRPGHRPARRLAWGAAAALVLAGAGVVLPLGSGGDPAFASWTAEPVAASERDAAVLREACLDQVGDTVGGDGAPELPTADLATRLTDRRGDWVSVLLTGTAADRTQFSVACLGRLPAGVSGDASDVVSTVTGGGGWAVPAGSELVEGPMAEFSVGGGPFGLGAAERAATTNGEVGPDVVGVTIHAPDLSVDASVVDGTYAAWWPGRVLDPEDLDDHLGTDPAPLLRYDVTLRDGTVIRDVDPVAPTG
ncbi:hypothetical protein [Nocardioides solisilvae]|uniref:hypothetical protein n=1 Tax=Nocardioides solisilvae TaxID=1542435 RepID=UPI000D74684E|nr:hypothetical protein [Nocardioides solisilvae]